MSRHARRHRRRTTHQHQIPINAGDHQNVELTHHGSDGHDHHINFTPDEMKTAFDDMEANGATCTICTKPIQPDEPADIYLGDHTYEWGHRNCGPDEQ